MNLTYGLMSWLLEPTLTATAQSAWEYAQWVATLPAEGAAAAVDRLSGVIDSLDAAGRAQLQEIADAAQAGVSFATDTTAELAQGLAEAAVTVAAPVVQWTDYARQIAWAGTIVLAILVGVVLWALL